MTLPIDTPATASRKSDPLLESVRDIEFVCPVCRGELDRSETSYECRACAKTYQAYGGIPDFRVFPDPFLDFVEDEERTAFVLGLLENYDLESLLDQYWSVSDITPPHLRRKFVRSAMRGKARAEQLLRVLRNGTFDEGCDGKRVLEIGSGTGNFLSSAMQGGMQVVGVDIAMRWLHVSRRRFMDLGLPVPPLVCCCAERLPFAENTFDLCVISSTLEFVRDPSDVLCECARTLGNQGSVLIQSVNRFSMARDPYSDLWGVGFLPRRWQSKYVRWRCGATYDNTCLLSRRELRRMAKGLYSKIEFALPDIEDDVLREFPFLTRIQVQLYRLLKRFPPAEFLLQWFGPGWNVKLSRPTVWQ